MLLTLIKQTKGYRIPSLLSPLLILVEVIIEVQIPFMMADMVNEVILNGANADMSYVVTQGLKMIGMALISLVSGAGAARFAAKAGMGFGSNLRSAIFAKIQDFSFGNIDRFSMTSQSSDIEFWNLPPLIKRSLKPTEQRALYSSRSISSKKFLVAVRYFSSPVIL